MSRSMSKRRGLRTPCGGTAQIGQSSSAGVRFMVVCRWLPAAASTITGHLSDLAKAGAKVGTMSRRLSAIKFVHQLQDLPDPTANARVIAVWEGIRRTHGAPPDQSAPLMPPELFDVLAACPTVKTWKTKGRAPEPDLAGCRDKALLLIWVRRRTTPQRTGSTTGRRHQRPRQRPGPEPPPVQNQSDRRTHRTGRPTPRRQP